MNPPLSPESLASGPLLSQPRSVRVKRNLAHVQGSALHTEALRKTLLISVHISLNPAASTSDWPQWRGPQRNGISQETGLLKQWPAEGPKLLWQAHDIGDGFSTPSVAGSRLYLMSNRGMENEFVQALSTVDGDEHRSFRAQPSLMDYPRLSVFICGKISLSHSCLHCFRQGSTARASLLCGDFSIPAFQHLVHHPGCARRALP